jgi:RNA polymerase sigma factor for flagellar operon FliA
MATTRIQAERHELKKHLSYVHHLATEVRRSLRLGGRVEHAELYSLGTMGLAEALARFDPARGCSFRVWARWRIVGAIYDGLRRQGVLKRGRDVARERPRSLTAAPPERPSAPDEATGREDPGAAEQRAEESVEPGGDPASDAERSEMARRLGEALGALDPRERALLHAYYWRDEALRTAARELGVSTPWASRLHARAVDRLRRVLAADG